MEAGVSATKPKPTIARLWRGRTTRAKADEYAVYLYEVGIKPLEEKALAVHSCARTAARRASSSRSPTGECGSHVALCRPRPAAHPQPRDQEFLIELPQGVQVLRISSSKGVFGN
jgi:hypothetical protein